MQPRPYWLQSDGDHNTQWRRLWTEPPWPKRRRPALAPTSNRPLIKASTSTAENTRLVDDAKARCRAAAEALFAPGRAA